MSFALLLGPSRNRVDSNQTAENKDGIRFNPKALALIAASAGSSLGLGFFLEIILALGFTLDLSLWVYSISLIFAFLLATSFLTILSLTATGIFRYGGIGLAALSFGLPFILSPNPINVPLESVVPTVLTYLGASLLLDYMVRKSAKIHAVFQAAIFSGSYGHFFQVFVFAVGILVFFSAQLPAQAHLIIPKEILEPSLNLVVNRVIEQVQGELGTTQFTEEEFLAELEETGLLSVLEQQFGITPDPKDINSPQKLAENLRQSLVTRLTADLEDFLEPYLPFFPLIAGAGATLSLFFLTPVFAWLSVAFFTLICRLLVILKFASFEQEQRQVPVLKI